MPTDASRGRSRYSEQQPAKKPDAHKRQPWETHALTYTTKAKPMMPTGASRGRVTF